MTALDQADYDFLSANGRLGASSGHYFTHLDQPIGVWNYIRIANSIARQITAGHILDWGCGYGQMTYLLRRRGFRVTSYDLGTPDTPMPDIPLSRGLDIVRTTHPTHLPFDDATFDAAFSMFGLMFFPDRKRGFAEIYRTLKPGGSIAVTSWAPVDQSPAMQTMFGALRAIKPDLPQPQRSISTLENPDVFRQEMQDAGFRNVEIRLVTKPFPVNSIPDFWEFMVRGSAPIQMLKKNMGEAAWREKEPLALDYLKERLPLLPTELTSDAWLGVGVK